MYKLCQMADCIFGILSGIYLFIYLYRILPLEGSIPLGVEPGAWHLSPLCYASHHSHVLPAPSACFLSLSLCLPQLPQLPQLLSLFSTYLGGEPSPAVVPQIMMCCLCAANFPDNAEIQPMAAWKFSEHCSASDAVKHRMLTDLFFYVKPRGTGFLLLSCLYRALARLDQYPVWHPDNIHVIVRILKRLYSCQTSIFLSTHESTFTLEKGLLSFLIPRKKQVLIVRGNVGIPPRSRERGSWRADTTAHAFVTTLPLKLLWLRLSLKLFKNVDVRSPQSGSKANEGTSILGWNICPQFYFCSFGNRLFFLISDSVLIKSILRYCASRMCDFWIWLTVKYL